MRTYLKQEAIPMIFELAQKLKGDYTDNKDLVNQTLTGFSLSLEEIEEEEEEEEDSLEWNDARAKKFIKESSENQENLLKTIVSNNNQLSTPQARNVFPKSPKPGQSLAGVLACLTRRCDRDKLPDVYDWDDDTDCYIISEEAFPFISKHI